ncbi:hypothetical protein S83_063674, partial [Arachis hypogaea]
KPIVPPDLYRSIRESQLILLSCYSREMIFLSLQLMLGLAHLTKYLVRYYVQSHIQINEYCDRVVLM